VDLSKTGVTLTRGGRFSIVGLKEAAASDGRITQIRRRRGPPDASR
jgi:hypothetical protein